ncbi:MAG: UDP-N-acetylmuramoyl-tripeptide--D-alanyl-D-alanine ligase [Cyanobacteriota bacterium]
MRREQLDQRWGQPVGSRAEALPDQLGEPCIDSRALETGQLFVPLVGERHDGHRFLSQAAAAGAVAALVQRDRAAGLGDPAVWPLPAWLVEDTLQAYQDLASLHRREVAVPVVAVTGSAGKTTTRELIRALLALRGPVLASTGNENNDIGVPLTLLRARPDHRAVVVEMGMRGLGEIARLSRCAAPDLAVITNIGTAHIGRLGSREAIASAKCEVVQALRPDGVVVIPAGDPLLEQALALAWSGSVRRVALASDPDPVARGCPPADLLGLEQEQQGEAWVEWQQGGDGGRHRLPLPGRHNARNFLLALAVAGWLDPAPITATETARLQLDLPGGRSRTESSGGITGLDETYNASPEAVLAALDLLAGRPGRRFAVLGTMLELGDQSLTLHRRVAERAAALGLDGLLIVDGAQEGLTMEAAAAGLSRLIRVATPAEALHPLLDWLRPGDHLLLKASRGVALEQLLTLLRQAHRTSD